MNIFFYSLYYCIPINNLYFVLIALNICIYLDDIVLNKKITGLNCYTTFVYPILSKFKLQMFIKKLY